MLYLDYLTGGNRTCYYALGILPYLALKESKQGAQAPVALALIDPSDKQLTVEFYDLLVEASRNRLKERIKELSSGRKLTIYADFMIWCWTPTSCARTGSMGWWKPTLRETPS